MLECMERRLDLCVGAVCAADSIASAYFERTELMLLVGDFGVIWSSFMFFFFFFFFFEFSPKFRRKYDTTFDFKSKRFWCTN
ncbi:hypothetical protein SISSUDRAFT_709521 [Sistotremastrum suecicum HHB10207 ss-3]|uniref:Uncharacterized protein n=1 Tax=Sistotremastrum suecicum HHB10207 ss-3 TaxID=1314776 RepID=A0A165WV55_9AGAM|nr:hypothetical protein SISSUDRAFT_709521 [Sistotremastrum suecicum HHB10207 ss-3]